MQIFNFHLQTHIKGPAEAIFTMLIDHEGYRFFPGFTSSNLIKPGLKHRDGVGAIRAGRFRGTYVVEEILDCDPPFRIEYRTIKCTIPLDHDRGIIDITPNGDGCDVSWRTSFGVKVPVVGDLIGRLCEKSLDRTIKNILLHVKREVERTQVTLELARSNRSSNVTAFTSEAQSNGVEQPA
ncbi:MAG: SRPBCC family protein [Pseudomonadales bacterium]|nr:SRPBCC family protein [Pseudomonadales bacterium]